MNIKQILPHPELKLSIMPGKRNNISICGTLKIQMKFMHDSILLHGIALVHFIGETFEYLK